MKNKHKFLIINIFVLVITIFNLLCINNATSKNIKKYSTMLASKITKFVVSNAYVTEESDIDINKIYEIIRGNDGEIKTIIYNTIAVNNLLMKITDRVHRTFDKLETGNLKNMNIRESILTNKRSNVQDGIILEIPSGLVTNNFIFSSLGPKIPIKIALTGELESHISTKVEEYGLNNALVTIYINIRVTEEVTMPFITEKIIIENQFPIAMNLINGKIPDYYLNGFDRNSNIYKTN